MDNEANSQNSPVSKPQPERQQQKAENHQVDHQHSEQSSSTPPTVPFDSNEDFLLPAPFKLPDSIDLKNYPFSENFNTNYIVNFLEDPKAREALIKVIECFIRYDRPARQIRDLIEGADLDGKLTAVTTESPLPLLSPPLPPLPYPPLSVRPASLTSIAEDIETKSKLPSPSFFLPHTRSKLRPIHIPSTRKRIRKKSKLSSSISFPTQTSAVEFEPQKRNQSSNGNISQLLTIYSRNKSSNEKSNDGEQDVISAFKVYIRFIETLPIPNLLKQLSALPYAAIEENFFPKGILDNYFAAVRTRIRLREAFNFLNPKLVVDHIAQHCIDLNDILWFYSKVDPEKLPELLSSVDIRRSHCLKDKLEIRVEERRHAMVFLLRKTWKSCNLIETLRLSSLVEAYITNAATSSLTPGEIAAIALNEVRRDGSCDVIVDKNRAETCWTELGFKSIKHAPVEQLYTYDSDEPDFDTEHEDRRMAGPKGLICDVTPSPLLFWLSFESEEIRVSSREEGMIVSSLDNKKQYTLSVRDGIWHVEQSLFDISDGQSVYLSQIPAWDSCNDKLGLMYFNAADIERNFPCYTGEISGVNRTSTIIDSTQRYLESSKQQHGDRILDMTPPSKNDDDDDRIRSLFLQFKIIVETKTNARLIRCTAEYRSLRKLMRDRYDTRILTELIARNSSTDPFSIEKRAYSSFGINYIEHKRPKSRYSIIEFVKEGCNYITRSNKRYFDTIEIELDLKFLKIKLGKAVGDGKIIGEGYVLELSDVISERIVHGGYATQPYWLEATSLVNKYYPVTDNRLLLIAMGLLKAEKSPAGCYIGWPTGIEAPRRITSISPSLGKLEALGLISNGLVKEISGKIRCIEDLGGKLHVATMGENNHHRINGIDLANRRKHLIGFCRTETTENSNHEPFVEG